MPDGLANSGDHRSAYRDWRVAMNLANPSGETTAVRQRTWRAVSAVVKEMSFTGRSFEVDRCAPFSRLIVMLDEVGDRIHGRDNARQGTAHPDALHRLYYVPGGAPFWTFAKTPRYARFISLQFSNGDLAALVADDFDANLPQIPRLAFTDARLLALAHVFEAECTRNGPDDPLLGDSLSMSLLSLLKSSGAAQPVRRARGGLTPRQLGIVNDYLHDHLAFRIGSRELAALTGHSAAHFHRAFKASTGLPPHAWLRALRIDRARALMLSTTHSLAEIAVETGFFDQAHFTRAFTKAVGLAPALWRRSAIS